MSISVHRHNICLYHNNYYSAPKQQRLDALSLDMDLFKRDQDGPEVGAVNGAPSQQPATSGASKPVRSLLSRARNSTINLASLANVTQRFHCSASVGNLWPPGDQQPATQQPQQQQQQQAVSSQQSSPSRKASTKEKRKRQKEAERIEKLKMLVSYLRSGSSQQLLNPVRLEADELELAQKYKQSQIMCEDCLQVAELRQQSQAGSVGSRTPDSQTPCCSSTGCCNSALPTGSSSSVVGASSQTKMFYIEELERGTERKESDTSDSTANSQQLIVIRTNQSQSQNLSVGGGGSSSSEVGLVQVDPKHGACQCCPSSHLRSMLSISTSESAAIARDLPTRSWSTELFLSSTPTSAVKKLVATATSPSHLAAAAAAAAGLPGTTPATLSTSQVDVTTTPVSSMCESNACAPLATSASLSQNLAQTGGQESGSKQPQGNQLNLTTTSSSNTSGVGQSSGSLPTVASATSFNLSLGPAAPITNSHLFHRHPQQTHHIQPQVHAHTQSNNHLQLLHNTITNLDYQNHNDNDFEESCCCGSSTTSSSSHTNNMLNNLVSVSSSNSNIVVAGNICSIDNIGSPLTTVTTKPFDTQSTQEQHQLPDGLANGDSSFSTVLSSSPSQQKTSTWTNPQTLATWIDNEVNSLVSDLEAKSQLIESKASKRSKRRWLSSSDNRRRNSSGSHST